MVPLLPVSHECKRRLGVKDPLGQDRYQEHLHLGDSQARGFFFQRSGKKLSILKVPTFEFGE